MEEMDVFDPSCPNLFVMLDLSEQIKNILNDHKDHDNFKNRKVSKNSILNDICGGAL